MRQFCKPWTAKVGEYWSSRVVRASEPWKRVASACVHCQRPIVTSVCTSKQQRQSGPSTLVNRPQPRPWPQAPPVRAAWDSKHLGRATNGTLRQSHKPDFPGSNEPRTTCDRFRLSLIDFDRFSCLFC